MGEQSHRNTTTSPLPPSSSPHLPPQPSTSSKLPFRPRKIRKLSNTNTNTITTTSLIRIPRNLSCEDEIQLAIDYLRSSDPILSPIIDLHSRPIFNPYQPPFIALTKSILYQQLANKAGTLIYTRFMDLCGGESRILPNNVLALTPTQLRHIGISARKSSYLHDLANKYCNDILSDKKILEMDDKSLFTMLTMVKGIGSWSTHMFMIFSLRRPDVLPIGDVAFRKGVQVLYGLEELPRPSQMEHLCEKWRPYRTVGAWYMWRLSEVKAAPGIGSLVNTVESQLPHRQILDSINGVVNFG
ncbi:hypothetical protein GIB67_005532 [Kingdonia uniflora]|uniref:HhH-GPD domain-containing protein n=1 Tax=Kingdonia uniflora TaxID=39325 RepID=A0A7J7NI39_9MAGN|nr:hypothetical protein GIB67_005532 [Kingdonia uniflora]